MLEPGSGSLAVEFARLSLTQRGGVIAAAILGGSTAPLVLAQQQEFETASPWAAVLVIGALAVFGACSAWLTITDVRERRLPNAVLLCATLMLTVSLSAVSLLWGNPASLVTSWVNVLVLSVLYFLLWWRCGDLVGAGDLKLAPASIFLPSWVIPTSGLLVFPLVLAAAMFVGGAIALVRRTRDIAFGPVMLFASWVAALAGQEIWRLLV